MSKTIKILLALICFWAGCAPASEDGSPLECGTGTHDDGSGVCQLDEVYAITNPSGLGDGAYWACSSRPAGVFYFYHLQFIDDGTGIYRYSNVEGGSYSTPAGFTWEEGNSSNVMNITGGYNADRTVAISWNQINSISPSPSVDPTLFGAKGLGASGNESFTCNAHTGAP